MPKNNIKNQSILVVDDEVKLGKLIAEKLSYEGYHTFSASNAKDGFKLAMQKNISLIITDVNMPKTNGFELVKKLRAEKKTQITPVIFLSGCEQQEYKIKGISIGANDYMTKPFDPNELEVKIKSLLKKI